MDSTNLLGVPSLQPPLLSPSFSHFSDTEEDPDFKDFTHITQEEEAQCKEAEGACQVFIKEKIAEVAHLFAEFIPKTGLKADEGIKKLPDLVKRVEQWRPLLNFSIQKKEQELKRSGEEWLRCADEITGELIEANKNLSSKIMAFAETQPAFETAKKFCNQFYRLYHEHVKGSLTEIKKKYDVVSEKLLYRLQIGHSSLTKKEEITLTKIFDSTQENIQSHLHNFHEKNPQFLEQKKIVIQKWKEINEEETVFRNNYDLFCFLVKRTYYLKSLQKADFWWWRNYYRFIDEATPPFSLAEQEKKMNSRRAVNVPSILSHSENVSPLSLKSSSYLETLCLSTKRTQRSEDPSESIAEEGSEEEGEQNHIDFYIEFFKANSANLKLAEQLCIALASKVGINAGQYLFCFDRIKAVVSSCSSFAKPPRAMKDLQLSNEGNDLISSIDQLSTDFQQQAKKLVEALSEEKCPKNNVAQQTLDQLGIDLFTYKVDYERKSLDLIKLSQIKNLVTQKLEKRIKADDKTNFSLQSSQLITTLYCLSKDTLREYQISYQAYTRLFTDQMKQIKASFEKMNKTILSFKNNFNLACYAINTSFSNTLFSRISMSWANNQFIHEEVLTLKGIDLPRVLTVSQEECLEKEEGQGSSAPVEKSGDEEEGSKEGDREILV